MSLGFHTAELNFENLEEIGHEGKNSNVYLAHDRQLDTEIVVKKIKKLDFNNVDDYYEEAKKLNVSYHTNVVKVMYGCSDDEHIYIAMPYYKNGSLKSLIKNRFLTVREVLRYSIQFLSGLHHIHSKGLIHCDIKPDNILLSNNNEALLSDFGLAKFMNESGFANPDNFYCKQVPPEAFQNTDKTIHYDIYLAGLTLYRLLNGDDHFNNQYKDFIPLNTNLELYKTAIINGNFPSRNAYLPHVPKKMINIVNKALSIEIEDRHQNVLELINDLSDVNDSIDWFYEIKGSVQTWSKQSDGVTIVVELELLEGGNTYNMTTTKTKKRTQRIPEHCYRKITDYIPKLKKAFKL